jgi:Transposase DDE domain
MLPPLGPPDDAQCPLTDAEVMTLALGAALFFGGNAALTCYFLHDQGYMRRMLSPGRFKRRLHRVKALFLPLVAFLGEHWKDLNSDSGYIIDSFPIASCDNIRSRRSRRYQGEDSRGYIASKKRYFYGLRVPLVVTATGEPVEFFLTRGEESARGALHWYQFDLPAGAQILGDTALNVSAIDDDRASIGIELCPLRKANSTRAMPPWETYLRELHRKYIETAGSMIMQRFPKTMHAVTAAGVELKIILFLLAYSFDCLAR